MSTRRPRASYTAWREMAPISWRNHLGHLVCGAVRSSGRRPKDGQALGRDLDTVLAKEIGWCDGYSWGRLSKYGGTEAGRPTTSAPTYAVASPLTCSDKGGYGKSTSGADLRGRLETLALQVRWNS